ncbi:MAG: hypothetical protein HOO06_13490 [Bdellovibrionaceae bacterium]|jgi:cardiolipin synthase C|nr:hypothetical protein [Pseudobdellovibrionaceae bacterium]
MRLIQGSIFKQLTYSLLFTSILLSSRTSFAEYDGNTELENMNFDIESKLNSNRSRDREVNLNNLNAVLNKAKSSSFTSKEVKRAVVITDNDNALIEKLNVIRNAQPGDTLRLVYFIFSNDKSSSVFSQALVNKARNGVKIKLLVDLHANYSNLDYFRHLSNSSMGNLDIRFYSRPSRNIQVDATYLTTSCGDALYSPEDKDGKMNKSLCEELKKSKIDAVFGKTSIKGPRKSQPNIYAKNNIANPNLKTGNIKNTKVNASKLFLSGLYSKDSDVMATAVLMGQEIDITKLSTSGEDKITAEDREDLMSYVKILVKLKTGNVFEKTSAFIQLQFAHMLYGEKLDPLYNMISGAIPAFIDDSKSISNIEGNRRTHGKDQYHLTDYTHHKLLLLTDKDGNNKSFVMGGRNIEDSYHVSKPSFENEAGEKVSMVHKYLFMDTDILVEMNKKAIKLANKKKRNTMASAYDRVFSVGPMVIKLKAVGRIMPNDFLVTLNTAKEQCSINNNLFNDTDNSKIKPTKSNGLGTNLNINDLKHKACMAQLKLPQSIFKMLNQPLPLDERLEDVKNHMDKMVGIYTKYTDSRAPSPANMEVDSKGVTYYYLENTHLPTEKDELRQYKVKSSEDYQYDLLGSNKNIHAALIAGMKHACHTSSNNNPQTVILQNAYVAPPALISRALGNMIDGTWSCEGATVKIITNSYQTTDLTPVNSFGRHQMKAIVDYHSVMKDKVSNGANIEYYEYQKLGYERSENRSLHSKVSVLGKNNIMIGSANLDFRSLMMDTNNALFLQNAPKLVGLYVQEVESLVKAGRIVKIDYSAVTREQLKLGNAKTSSKMNDSDQSELMSVMENYGIILSQDKKRVLDVCADSEDVNACADSECKLNKDFSDEELAQCISKIENSQKTIQKNAAREKDLFSKIYGSVETVDNVTKMTKKSSKNYVEGILDRVYRLTLSAVANVAAYGRYPSLWWNGEPESNLLQDENTQEDYYLRFQLQHADSKGLDAIGGPI